MTPKAPAAPQAPVAAPQAAPSLSAALLSPSVDMSVFDGDNSSNLLALHAQLQQGLADRGLQLPTRYRPGQHLNSDLLGAASEILSAVANGYSDEEINQVIDETLCVGRLHALIQDEGVQSIYLNGAHHLVCSREGGKLSVINAPFSSVEQARVAAARILGGLGVNNQERAEGRLGDLRVYVDLNGAEGPYVCIQRPVNRSPVERWVEERRFDRQAADLLARGLPTGLKVAIAAKSTKAQAQVASALALSCLKGRRVITAGVSYAVGNDAAWVTLPCEMDALLNASQLAPDFLLIADQPAFDGGLVLEALSAAPAGALLVTARSSRDAVAKLCRRAVDAALVGEALDLLLFVEQDSAGHARLSEIYSFARGDVVYQNGNWTGAV
jgi:hypothetical protein